MFALSQSAGSFASAGSRPFSLQPRWLRYALLLLVGLVPVALDLSHLGHLVYLQSAFVQFLAAGFCIEASRRFPAECLRWRFVAAATACHAIGYLCATMDHFRWITDAQAAWLGNLGNALWVILLIPALMGQRLGRGKAVRFLDRALATLSVVLLMATLGSGLTPGNGSVRIWTGVVLLAALTSLALSLQLADNRTGLRRFTRVMVWFLLLELADTVLINVVMYLYLPNTPDLIPDLLIPLPELLLCNWVLETMSPASLPRFQMDRTIVDSVQPSLLAVMSVGLALYGFRHAPVLAATSVIAVVLCYAVRTQAYYAQLFHERSRLVSQATEYEQLATRDPLTGIGNRRWFDASLQAAFSNPDAFPCTLLLVDTDHFKQVNDSRGHDAGDAVLCTIAQTLEREAGSTQQPCIARIGGDEFAALLRNIEEREALALAERIRVSVSETCQSLGYPITVSIGIATTQDPLPRKPFVDAADAALYRAKAKGRNAVCGSASI